ncbi:MAG: OmpA family protein [Bacteroidota bacterium]
MRKLNIILLTGIVTLILSFPVKGQVEKLPQPINQPDSHEKSPALSPDGKHLLFLSNREGAWNIYVAEKTGGEWGKPEMLEEISSSFSKNRIIEGPSFNHDAKRIYFSVYPWGEKEDSDIYYTERNNGEWGVPRPMPLPVNSDGYEGMPSISADNTTIYFVRQKEQTDKDYNEYDCKEIYFSKMKGHDSWSEPKKLANPINLECESCPRILPDNNTIIFSSVRPGKKINEGEKIKEPQGDFDLYITKRLFMHIWSIPRLLDVNTPGKEHSGTMSIEQEEIIFSRNAEGEKTALYSYKNHNQKLDDLLILKGKVTDKHKQKPVKAKIHLINPATSQTISRYSTDNNGNYYILLDREQEYLIDYHDDDYSHKFQKLNPDTLKTEESITKDIKLYDKVELLCNVYDKDIYEPINGDISVIDKASQTEIRADVEKKDDGKFLVDIPIGNEYKIKVNKEHYKSYGINLDLSGVVQYSKFEKDIEMTQKKKTVDIQVKDKETDDNMPVRIKISNLDKDETIIKEAKQNKDGMYNLELREGDNYEINISSQKGYAFYNKEIEAGKGDRSGRMDIELEPLKEEVKLPLKMITFETNSAQIKESSYEELGRVADLIKKNEDIKIEISAHTDDVGSKEYNQKLSQRRAQSVVDYLTDEGVPPEQMVSKGYGESNPLVPNNSDENRAKNRRVELEILEVEEKDN